MSDTPATDTPLSLEDRIAELEADNAGIKKVGFLLVVLTIVIGIMMVVSVREIHDSMLTNSVIITDGGQSRAALTVLKGENRSGHLGMLFYDNLGLLPSEVDFGRMPDLDGMVFYDRKGKPRIAMGVDANDQAIIMVLAPDGRVLFRAGLEQRAPATQIKTSGGTATPAATSTPTPATSATPAATATPGQ